MKCSNCGTEINNGVKFCPKCGADVSSCPPQTTKESEKKKDNEVKEYKLTDGEIERLSNSFASKNEKYISSLGNGYIMNYLANKTMSRGFAFITDKRVYFKGSCLSGTGKMLVKTNEERTVDVKDITGSGFTYDRHLGIIIVGFLMLILSLFLFAFVNLFGKALGGGLISLMAALISLMIASPLMIPSIIILKNYLFKRKTLFRIEYAGGCIAFNVSFYAKAEIDDFQKQLRRAKDLAEESVSKITVTESLVQPSTQNSVPDDLRKYADLLKDGLISQEEYDAMKKKILNL